MWFSDQVSLEGQGPYNRRGSPGYSKCDQPCFSLVVVELSLGVQVLVSQVFPLGAHIGFNVVWEVLLGVQGSTLNGSGGAKARPLYSGHVSTLASSCSWQGWPHVKWERLTGPLSLSPVWLKALSC